MISTAGRFAAAIAVTIAASSLMSDFRAGQLSLFLSLAVLAVSLDLVWGYTGILSLGQLLPFGVSAYMTARLATEYPSSSLVTFGLAIVVGAAISALVGFAAFRRRLSVIVFGLLTLMLSLTFEQIAEQWRGVTGGFNGLTDVPGIQFFGASLGDGAQDLVISVLAVTIIAGVGLLVSRPIGAVLIGVRDNERRMEALGYDVVSIKVWVYALGGAVAGLAGTLYVHRTGFVSPGIFGFTLATNLVLWTLIGGRGTIIGAVLGTLAINFAAAALADAWLQYWVLATGIIFVAATVFVPDGVVPAVLRATGRQARRTREPTLNVRDVEAVGDSSEILTASQITKSFGPFVVLEGITLAIDRPELLCIIGPNGAGKSTLLDILCGQQRHQDGEIRVFGETFTNKPAWAFARAGVSRKFQTPEIVQSLSVAENIAVASWGTTPSPWVLCVTPWSALVPNGVLGILETTGLDERLTTPAGDLSHGEKQWLEIAMAMCGSCRILLLDEPTAGMTVAESMRAADLLRELNQTLELPVVVVEHDIAFVRAVADRVAVLARGGLLADGTVAEIDTNEDVRAVYLGTEA